MKRKKSRFVQYDVMLSSDPNGFQLATVIGIDCGEQDWARGRRVAINPNTGADGLWTVTDVDTGSAYYHDAALQFILTFADNLIGKISDDRFWETVHGAKQLRASVTNLVPKDMTERCAKALRIKPTDTVVLV